jgi:hypothetical protein
MATPQRTTWAEHVPLRGRGAANRRARWWIEAAAIVWLLWIYDDVNNLAPLRQVAATRHAWSVLHVELSLHLAPELALNHWLAARHALGLIVADYYDIAHFAVTLGLLAWLWWRRADVYRPLRTSLVLINAIGLVVFWRYPLAPPRMLGAAGFNDVVANTGAWASWHRGALASQANQLAAMPSLHMAWAAWSALVVWRLWPSRLARCLAVAYPVLTALVVMATGNHFLFDIAGGLLTTLAAVLVTERLARARRLRALLPRIAPRRRGRASERGARLESPALELVE